MLFMLYEWDKEKSRVNLAKHGITFEKAREFDWETALERHDAEHGGDEDRWQALGDAGGVLYMIVYTEREDRIRLISMHKATPREARYHARQHPQT